MSSWHVRRSYGYGAARVPLAPVFALGPFTVRESFADCLAAVAEELAALDPKVLVRRSAAAVLSLALTLAGVALVTPAQERDRPTQDLVLILPEPAPPEPLAPEPEPLLEPEPTPLPLAAREPVAPPPLLERVAPPPPPPARVVPVAAEPAPWPAPRLHIDAIASAPETAPLPSERASRNPAQARTASALRIDPVAPSFPVAAMAAAAPSPLRTAAHTPPRATPPVAFALDPLAAAPASSPVPTYEHTAPRAAPARMAPAPLPHLDPVAPPARLADVAAPIAPPLATRVTRSAVPEQGAAAPPSRSFQGVPLGSLAACVSDREEDSLKLSVMAAAGPRSSCSSRAGSYRFVETKNLNAFLMWIERSPGRKAADRCIELRLALECLAGTPNRRTDNG